MTSPEQLHRDFRRSSRFGVIGVVVVMVVSAGIALLFAQNSARPTGALIAIFAIVFGFVFVLLRLQRGDLDRARARSRQDALEPSRPVEDPTTADTNDLLAALAVKPIDREAIAAAGERVWGFAGSSISSASILMVLIACAVIPWQLFTAYWSILIFVPIIAVYVGYLAARAIGAGGQLEQAYDDAAATLAPLGLQMTERPEVVVRERIGSPGAQARLSGAAVYTGQRRGRRVEVRIEGSEATTRISGAVTAFEVEAKGERLGAVGGAPAEIESVLAPLRASSYWKGVSIEGGEHGVVVTRTRDGGLHWMRDLWLAERLADAARA